ncbi:ribosome maturation factor RimM [Sphingopyxis indica]|uniref:Ribosome maturation factor RimM n=1 Tax=Sphingopyxis indica TaxID=436663 RepID=A0A239GJ94_9SPHN|nr:ribosome maturation factor RimM [Sphingopyxis indica]SNS68872.1 16S rRNA processing protein RimM [Sphingopyxis indica]
MDSSPSARPTPNPSRKREGDKADRPVTLAAIAGAHGVRGEVRLKLFGEGVQGLRAFSAFDAGGRKLTLKSLRPANQGAVAQFAEITDRSAAEALRGTVLTVPRSALPPLGEGEYYHHDLIGLACTSTDGTALGTVIAVENFGAGDILEIERPSEGGKKAKRFMVPMNAQAVPAWSDDGVTVNAAFAE